jgi:hypothetical protein
MLWYRDVALAESAASMITTAVDASFSTIGTRYPHILPANCQWCGAQVPSKKELFERNNLNVCGNCADSVGFDQMVSTDVSQTARPQSAHAMTLRSSPTLSSSTTLSNSTTPSPSPNPSAPAPSSTLTSQHLASKLVLALGSMFKAADRPCLFRDRSRLLQLQSDTCGYVVSIHPHLSMADAEPHHHVSEHVCSLISALSKLKSNVSFASPASHFFVDYCSSSFPDDQMLCVPTCLISFLFAEVICSDTIIVVPAFSRLHWEHADPENPFRALGMRVHPISASDNQLYVASESVTNTRVAPSFVCGIG